VTRHTSAAMKARKTWQEKLDEDKGLPRVGKH
jgi:hypothetical protein